MSCSTLIANGTLSLTRRSIDAFSIHRFNRDNGSMKYRRSTERHATANPCQKRNRTGSCCSTLRSRPGSQICTSRRMVCFTEPVDLFINVSDHSTEYERREYELIEQKLTESAVILGDNAHCNSELHDFSARSNRQFLYWQEWPINHWYPGCGIGFSFKLPK